MSRLNFKSLGIALIVVVILLVAITASWSYHSVPAPQARGSGPAERSD